MVEFHVGQFKIARLSEKGLWAVTGESSNEVGLLMMRAQEFYESTCPDIIGKSFTLGQFIKFYSEKVSETKVFSYLDDFQGYNVPGDVLDLFLDTPILDPNPYDFQFARIVQAVKVAQSGGAYYIVGAKQGKVAFMDHEIAHGMWYLLGEYNKKALALVNSLPLHDKDKVIEALKKEGYTDAVMDDEINAYFATGLIESLEDYEHLREPFMKLFYRYKRGFLDKPKKTGNKPTPVARAWPFDFPKGDNA